MGTKSRVELLREIDDLQAEVRQLDRQLAKLKLAPARPEQTTLSKARRRRKVPQPADDFSRIAPIILKLFAKRAALFEADEAGQIVAAHGTLVQTLLHDVPVSGRVDSFISERDKPRWRDWLANFSRTDSENPIAFDGMNATEASRLHLYAARGISSPQRIWVAIVAEPLSNDECAAGASGSQDLMARYWAGVFAHELNQPLAAALASAQGCRELFSSESLPAEERAELLEGVVRRVQLAADVVRRLRLLAGGEPPRRRRAHLNDLVRRAIDVLQAYLDERRISLTLDFAHDVPPVNVDEVQMVQVLVNVVRNAIEAMNNVPVPDRQLTIRTARTQGRVIVAIEDRGPGLSVEAIKNLFHPLVSQKPSGMGLGLALCRQIVDAHGGSIWAVNSSPVGCTFFIALPLDVGKT